MNRFKDMIGTAIGVAMALGFTTFLVALVLALASEQLPAIKSIWVEVRCIAGFPAAGSACVLDQIAALDAQRRDLAQESQRLTGALAAQGFVFTQGEKLKDGFSLVVGTLYRDPARQAGVLRSFCWIIVDNEGLDPRVGLAVMHEDGRTERLDVDATALVQLGMSARAVNAARAACPFPVI